MIINMMAKNENRTYYFTPEEEDIAAINRVQSLIDKMEKHLDATLSHAVKNELSFDFDDDSFTYQDFADVRLFLKVLKNTMRIGTVIGGDR